ncbi:tripartite motif-containing protein 2-like isoform X2 [Babylonia areolata]|uniref:tripartite motif-containing protein 2-like isoform X2 n=1 Tax=Babylonia areolata TaxID=304850 RepID=UPI003FD0F254
MDIDVSDTLEPVEVSGETATARQEVEVRDFTVSSSEDMQIEDKVQGFPPLKTTTEEPDSSMDSRSLSQHQMREMEKNRRRNLIFDEERFEDTFLKCLICREAYNQHDKMPKMLPCHHTFCLYCLCQMFRVEGEFRQALTSAFRGMPMAVKIQCPTCREGLITSEAELRRLPNDHTIVDLLSFVKDTGRSEVQYCSKHQMQPLHFFCEPCIQPVCCDCTVIDHKEAKGHVVVNVDEALNKYTPILNDTMKDIEGQRQELTRKKQSLEQAKETVEQIQQDLTKHIRSVFDRIRTALDEREQQLYDLSSREIHRKRQMIEGHLTTLTERESSLSCQFSGLQQARDEKDISQMFLGHKTARELLQKHVHVPTDCVKDFNVTFQFSTRTDAAVRQQVSSLGNILFQS